MNNLIEIDDRSNRSNRAPKPSRIRRRTALPSRVTLAEDASAYEDLLIRLETELSPKNVQQEGDALALGQLRWRMERLDLVETQTLNFHLLHHKLPPDITTNEQRLTFAYRQAVCDPSYNQIQRNHLATTKTMHHIAARVERWDTKKAKA